MRLNVEASCFCVHVLDRCGQVSLWSDHYYAWVGVFRCLWSDQYYALSWGGQVSVKWSVLCPELGWSGVCEVIGTVPWVRVVRCLWSDQYCALSWGGQVSMKWSVLCPELGWSSVCEVIGTTQPAHCSARWQFREKNTQTVDDVGLNVLRCGADKQFKRALILTRQYKTCTNTENTPFKQTGNAVTNSDNW